MDTHNLATMTGAARVTGIPRSTIRSAADRGDIEVYELGDGTAVIDLAELKAWQAKRAADIMSPEVVDEPTADGVS